MTAQELEIGIRPLVRSFRSARRWLWLQRALRVLAQSVCAATLFALVAAVLTLFQAPGSVISWLWTAAFLSPAAGVVAAILVRPDEAEAIRIADLRLGLHQELGTAHELLTRGTEGMLVPWQIARATDLAEEARLSAAFPLLPKKELAVAAPLVAASVGALVAVSLGVVLSNPFQDLKVPIVARPASAASEPRLFGNGQQNASATTRRSPALDSTRQILNQIQRQAQRGTLSPAAAANALQQANAELNKAAQESLLRQQALDYLATQLRGNSAGNDISQSLRQGDYQKAAQQIKDLGRQSDQLSDAAKQQLSQALSDAASQSQGTQQLSRPESRTSQALRNGDSQQASFSSDRLAQAVEDTGNQLISQSELAQTWQQLQDLNKQLTEGNQNGNGQQAQTAPNAQSPDSTGEKSSGMQGQNASGDDQSTPDPFGEGVGQNGPPQPGSGGTPGNTPGGPPLGNANPPVGADGKSLELSGQVADQFSGQPDTGSQPPSVMRQGDAGSSGGQAQAADASASVPAENVFVPSDRRSIVRDYFSSGN